jgi:hypothetical protein
MEPFMELSGSASAVDRRKMAQLELRYVAKPQPDAELALVRFNQPAVIQRAERDHTVGVRITDGSASFSTKRSLPASRTSTFCEAIPRAFGEALREIRVEESRSIRGSRSQPGWTSP